MKGKSGTPKKVKTTVTELHQGGMGPVQRRRRAPDVSMTPDTFDRSQTKMKKKAAWQRRSFDANATQIIADETQWSQDESMFDNEETPLTLSQISEINPLENDSPTTFTKRKRKRSTGSNNTLEMAVQCARGEPDGADAADRSFTRKQVAQMSLRDIDSEGAAAGAGGGNDAGDVEMDSERDGTPSPAKRAKSAAKENKGEKKEKKTKLKIPFKQASKKLKSLKTPAETDKAKKLVNKKFDALPDETTVPETPTKTWKEKKKQRKMMKNNFDVITEAKKVWEDLRRADLPEVKRKKICDDLMRMVTGKVKQLCKAHDSARIVQCLVQYGTEQQRATIYEEIRDEICDMCRLKYAKYVVRKLIHYGSKTLRGEVMNSFQGQVRKMIRHKEASDILEYAFNEYATAPQRLAILEEFYGPTFSLFKDQVHQSLEQIMQDQPEKKNMVIRSMKEALAPLVDKEILIHSLVHKVFFDFFLYADDKSKKEMIEGLRESLPHLLHTRDGTRVAMHCVWSGSVKDRKSIVKSLKGHVVKICQEEHGHLLLLAIFDCVDDTVLVQKVILDELVKSLGDVAQNQHGRKVLVYLLNPRDRVHCHPDVVKVLQQGDDNPTSKKDRVTRGKELRGHVSQHLLKYLAENVGDMMKNSNMALLVKDIINYASGDVVPAMRSIADFVAQPASGADGAIAMVEHTACHMALKKIIANDRIRMEAGEGILFSAVLLESLPKSTIKSWAASNRGCFVLVSLLEVGCSTITERVQENLQPVRKSLSKMSFKGAELLLSKLEGGGETKSREYRGREYTV
ncbi:pumilio homolog 3 [Aplysia californica]|uniref:Pumilio homolog 3 n=1 Tax=Aplysia californica TaxID=6500 RepID=A0ABM1W3P9_APLCA|nr:pumilio homolog 3 [Aplysia californica]